jgi:hypothetical protein
MEPPKEKLSCLWGENQVIFPIPVPVPVPVPIPTATGYTPCFAAPHGFVLWPPLRLF